MTFGNIVYIENDSNRHWAEVCVRVCVQTEPPSQKHVQIQKELWRIQDVMEALNKNKPKRNTEPSERTRKTHKHTQLTDNQQHVTNRHEQQ